jgi:TetR/AcrR family transcriptional regulator
MTQARGGTGARRTSATVGADAPVAARRAPGRPPSADGGAIAAETILSAALRAFATHGYDSVSLRTLSLELGGSHSLVGQRFGTKAALWKSAVDYGFGRITSDLTAAFDPTIEDPLDQLHRWIRRFLELSADHAELLGLVDLEGRSSSPRLTYLFDSFIAPSLTPIGALLAHLVERGTIRPIPVRAFYFLVVHGGAASHSLVALAQHFDPRTPLSKTEVHDNATLIADIVISGLRLSRPDATGSAGMSTGT